ncbi:KH domain-containing protein akap-1 [Drosophila miranda]|uniref:KH domain-containing protein akap-1 n=1 Tax=Drosophila miranda TaxID=7229 RepID=UPI00143F5D53|nr:KH domain-containing protein akap-1 [Drosophila miranda]
MGKPTNINLATNFSSCHGQKQSDVECLVFETATRIEGIIGKYNQNNENAFFVGQTEYKVRFPFLESGVDNSVLDCAQFLGNHACANKKEYINHEKIEAQAESSFEEEAQPDSPFEEKAQPDSSFKEEAQPDSSFKEEAQPDSSFKEEAQYDSAFKEEAQPDSSFKEEAQPDSSFKEEAQPDSAFKEEAQPDSSFKEEAQPDSAFKEEAQPDSSFKEEAQPDSSFKEEAQPDSSFKEEAQPDSSFKEEAQPDSSFKEEAQPDSSFKEEAQPDSSFKEEAQYDSAFKEEAQPDSSFKEEAQPDSSFKEAAQPDSAFKEEAQPDSSFKEEAQPDSAFKEEAQPDSSFKEEAQPDSSFKEEAQYDSSFKEEAITLPGETKAQQVKSKDDGLIGDGTAASSTYSYDSDDNVVEEHEKDKEPGNCFRGQAVPKCCLTDSVFMIDRPRCAVMLKQELRRFSLLSLDAAKRQAKFKISVTNVYSPFQFWFQIADENCPYDLENLHLAMNDFYQERRRPAESSYQKPITRFFLRPGYICAARPKWGGWKRVRIVSAPQENTTDVSVFYVDYGRLEKCASEELRFLPKLFSNIPAMAVRGALSHIHPLNHTWPADVTEELRAAVLRRETFAHIIEADQQDEIYSIKIYQHNRSDESLNSKMILEKLAGESDHFDERIIKQHCGRRIRYLCERLPTFEMLETGVFPMDADKDLDFVKYFNGIMSATSYFREFKIPTSHNPLRQDLEKALRDWMVGYKKEQMPLQKLQREAARRAKEKEKNRRTSYEKLFYKRKD